MGYFLFFCLLLVGIYSLTIFSLKERRLKLRQKFENLTRTTKNDLLLTVSYKETEDYDEAIKILINVYDQELKEAEELLILVGKYDYKLILSFLLFLPCLFYLVWKIQQARNKILSLEHTLRKVCKNKFSIENLTKNKYPEDKNQNPSSLEDWNKSLLFQKIVGIDIRYFV